MNIELAIKHLQQEPQIGHVIANTHVPDFAPSGKIYYDLLDSIVSQQLSVKAATTIFNRFCALFPDHYPHPELVHQVPAEQLRAVGLSFQKAGYLQNVATFAQQNDLENHNWGAMTDEEIIGFLTQIKGVGKWTTQMLLMFSLGRPDIFPVDDLGIQQGMQRLFKIDAPTTKALKIKMLEHAEPWQPWRTIACRYLWRWKDNKIVLDSLPG